MDRMPDGFERDSSSELFETAFRYAAIGMALVGLDGRFLRINNAFCALVGYPEAEMLGLDFQTITHPDDLDLDLALLDRLLKGEFPNYEMDKRYRRADGQLVWAHLSVALVRHPDGRPRHFIAQVQDITARRNAEARYQLMAEHVTDVIVTTDLAGYTRFVAPSCQAITGFTAEELTGVRPMDHAHPDDVDKVRDVFHRLLEGKPGRRVRWRGRHKTEEGWIWLESNPSLLPPDEAGERVFLDVMREVTAQVAQEQALAEAKAEAEAATRAKSTFLANMSHEIRTPLTAIIGFAGLLSSKTNLDEEARAQVDHVARASKALLSIVNDVLDFSKLEAGRVELIPSPVSPTDVVRSTFDMFMPQAEAKGLSLEFQTEGDMPDYVSLDPDRLRQIILNLVGNALKFTRAGFVRLVLGYDESVGHLRLQVEDSGPGLTDDQQAQLFQRFAQVDASSRLRHGGTGLGLAICKGLVEAMGGEIGVRSTPGSGSIFFFDVAAPVATEPQAAAEPAAGSLGLDGVRVLVVDDNPVNRELARAILEPVGVQIDVAEDGEAAIAAAAALPYDVVLLDIRMPVMDGPTALRHIRAAPGPNRNTPVLAFSADTDLERLVDAAGGFDGVVRKPIDPASLISMVAMAVATEPPCDAAAGSAASAGAKSA
jgi:PAS domain S-box-containing protein